MRFNNVNIEALAYHLPDSVVTSEDLEIRMAPLYEKLKLPVGRLQLMTGIRERRFWDVGVMPSEISTLAGEKVLEKSGIDRSMIGCLISGSVCRDFMEPATASLIHHNLRLPRASQVFDISNACLGVLNGMVHIANMIELGHIQAGLVVAGENGGPLVFNTIETLLSTPGVTRKDIKKSFASLTIGSAAVGVLLTHKNISQTGHRLLGGVSYAATQFNDLCRGSEDNGSSFKGAPLMDTDSETLMKEGCALAGETWQHFKRTLNWKNNDVDRVFCHQVGTMHRNLLLDTIDMDLAKDFSTLETLGNTGSASLPVTLAMGEEQGALQRGNHAALLGIGSGLNSLMLGVEW
jgi:acyl-CoA:acyl-CoA alkyltransferase